MLADLVPHDTNLAVHLYEHGQLIGGAMGGVQMPTESEDAIAVQEWIDRFTVGLQDEASFVAPSFIVKKLEWESMHEFLHRFLQSVREVDLEERKAFVLQFNHVEEDDDKDEVEEDESMVGTPPPLPPPPPYDPTAAGWTAVLQMYGSGP